MQTLKTKLALAKWRDRAWQYHGSESHADASLFRTRMRAYGKPEREPVSNLGVPITLGKLLRGGKR